MKAPVRIVTLLAAAFVWLLASGTSALADAPASSDWPAAPARSLLDNILLFGGATIGLFVVIWLFGLLMARNNYVPPEPGTDLEIRGDRSPAQH